MSATYWILVEKPRFKFFPWFFTISRGYEYNCEYTEVCSLYNEVIALITKRQSVLLGVEREGGLQVLHANYHKQSIA